MDKNSATPSISLDLLFDASFTQKNEDEFEVCEMESILLSFCDMMASEEVQACRLTKVG